jgi:hypothetical protein
VGGGEDDARRGCWQQLSQLQAREAGHVNVEKYDINGMVLQEFHGR